MDKRRLAAAHVLLMDVHAAASHLRMLDGHIGHDPAEVLLPLADAARELHATDAFPLSLTSVVASTSAAATTAATAASAATAAGTKAAPATTAPAAAAAATGSQRAVCDAVRAPAVEATCACSSTTTAPEWAIPCIVRAATIEAAWAARTGRAIADQVVATTTEATLAAALRRPHAAEATGRGGRWGTFLATRASTASSAIVGFLLLLFLPAALAILLARPAAHGTQTPVVGVDEEADACADTGDDFLHVFAADVELSLLHLALTCMLDRLVRLNPAIPALPLYDPPLDPALVREGPAIHGAEAVAVRVEEEADPRIHSGDHCLDIGSCQVNLALVLQRLRVVDWLVGHDPAKLALPYLDPAGHPRGQQHHPRGLCKGRVCPAPLRQDVALHVGARARVRVPGAGAAVLALVIALLKHLPLCTIKPLLGAVGIPVAVRGLWRYLLASALLRSLAETLQ
mmetsp:Transcript_57334/g.147946  ORF Transcript_57334/g.147946 Transcript_57334/m.147946 type:complete len:458 (-) Transcript_57334:488-1861(-)